MKYIALLTLLVSSLALANEDLSYCDYTTEKSEADRIQLVYPTIVVGGGRNSTTFTNVTVFGVNESLSHYLKGKLQKEIGAGDCQLFHVMNDLTKRATYDGIVISNEIAIRKIEYMRDGIAKLDALIATEKERLVEGTSTIVLIDTLESTKAKMVADLIDLQTQTDPSLIPAMSSRPIDEIIADVNSQLVTQQHLIAKSNKYDNWDISVSTGTGMIAGTNQIKPFGSINASISLGTIARNHALDKSVEAYSQYANEQTTGPVQLALVLKRKIEHMIVVNRTGITATNQYKSAVDTNLLSIKDIETVDAHRFAVQLAIDSINTDIEARSLQSANIILLKYLARNYSH